MTPAGATGRRELSRTPSAPPPYPAGFLAAKAHLAYRRRGGTRIATLPDFYIGAHAVIERLTLVTRDVRRYRLAFPTLKVFAP